MIRTHRTFRQLVAAVALALLAAMILTPAPSFALGKVKCGDNGAVAVGSYDPIVNHNGTGSAHEHQFFGNIAWHSLANPNTANYPDLAGKANSCRVSVDSAGYWIPSLRYTSGPKAGQLVPAQQFTAYYRSFDHKDFGPGLPYPADTRLVASRHDWGCGQYSGVPIGPTIPSCVGQSGKPGHTLTAHIDFPSCWDGVLPNHQPGDVGNTSDSAHYAYVVKSGTKRVCPAGFPNRMVELRESFQFQYVGPGDDVALSSDAPGQDGGSLHADFWNTWQQGPFEAFVRDCVTAKTAAYSTAKCQP